MFITKAKEWLSLIQSKDTEAIVKRMAKLKTELVEADEEFAKSYEVMYKMLESTEN